jgi:hypothetical protein
MQVLLHTFTYFSTVTLDTEALVVPWYQFTYSLLVPEGRLAQRAQILWYCKCSKEARKITLQFSLPFTIVAEMDTPFLINPLHVTHFAHISPPFRKFNNV